MTDLDKEIKKIFKAVEEEPIEPTKLAKEKPDEFKRAQDWCLKHFNVRLL